MTYDQWKTTDPREYEQLEEDQPSELDEVYEELFQARERIKILEEALAERNREEGNSGVMKAAASAASKVSGWSVSKQEFAGRVINSGNGLDLK